MKILNLFLRNNNSTNSRIKRTFLKKILAGLGNLKFAIILLLVIAIFSALGTIIEQNKDLSFYKTAYPELGNFFNWKLVYYLQLDHIYQAWWYLLLIFTLGCSLMICTVQRQYPALKVARKYTFLVSPTKFQKLYTYQQVPLQTLYFFLRNLASSNYYLFCQKRCTYAYKGLSGKVAPIIIHFSLLFILLGTATSASTGYIAQEMVVKGEIFHIQNLSNFGNLSYLPQKIVGRVNNFWIEYKENNIDQFFSNISILDANYNVQKTETIFVNKPLKYSGVTIYQTDWNIVGLRLLLDDQIYIQVPLKQTVTDTNQTLWTGALEDKTHKLISFVIQDLQNQQNIWTYDSDGNFLQKTQIQKSIFLDGHEIKVLDILSATGLQIKQDSGIVLIYLGFFFLMTSVLINNISYVQVFLLQTDTCILVGGKATRDPAKFKLQFLRILKDFHIRQLMCIK